MESNEPYFYADRDAEFYDAVVRLTDRSYDTVHEVTCDVLCTALRPCLSGPHAFIVDLGCGTGEEAFRILRCLPDLRVLAVDSSAKMLSVLEQKARTILGDSAADRVVPVLVDFRAGSWTDDVLARAPAGHRPAAIVSVFALHHLIPHKKAMLYAHLAAMLADEMPFINGDLFSFSSPWLASVAQKEEEDWLSDAFAAEELWMTDSLRPLARRRNELLRLWLDHLRHENVPLPVHRSDRRAPHENEAAEFDILADVGFRTIECVYRRSQAAVVIARK